MTLKPSVADNASSPSPFGQPGPLLSPSSSNVSSRPSLENFHFNIIGQQPPELLKRISPPNPKSQYLGAISSPESAPPRLIDTDRTSSTPSVSPAPPLAPLQIIFHNVDPRATDAKNTKRSRHAARRDSEEIKVMGTPIVITRPPETNPSREINPNGAMQDPIAANSAPPKPHEDPNNRSGGRQRLFLSPAHSPSPPTDAFQHILTPQTNTLRPFQPESKPSTSSPNSSQQSDYAATTLKSSASSLLTAAQQAYELTHAAHATSSRFLVSFDPARAAIKEAASVIEATRAAFESAQVAFDRASDAWKAIEGLCQSGMHDFEGEIGKAQQALDVLSEAKGNIERIEAERSMQQQEHQRLSVEKEQNAAENIIRLRRELEETKARTLQQVEAERTEKDAERVAKEKLESVIAQLVGDKKDLLRRQAENEQREKEDGEKHRQEIEDLVAKLTAQTEQRERQEQFRAEAERQSRIQVSQGQNHGRGEPDNREWMNISQPGVGTSSQPQINVPQSSQIPQSTHIHALPSLSEIPIKVNFKQSPRSPEPLPSPSYPISAALDRNQSQSRREDTSGLQNEPFRHTQALPPSPPSPKTRKLPLSPSNPSRKLPQPPKRFKAPPTMPASPLLTEAQMRHNLRHLITPTQLSSQTSADQNSALVAENKPNQSPENKFSTKHEIKREEMTTPSPSGQIEAGPNSHTPPSSDFPSADMDCASNVLPPALARITSLATQPERVRPLVDQFASATVDDSSQRAPDSSMRSHHSPKTVESSSPVIKSATRTSGEGAWLGPGGNRPDSISPEYPSLEPRPRIQAADHWSPPPRRHSPPSLPPPPRSFSLRVDHYSPSPPSSPVNEWYPRDSRARWSRSNVSPPPLSTPRKRPREDDPWSLDAAGYPSRRNWPDDPRQRDRREIDSGPSVSRPFRYRDEVVPRRRTPPPLHHPISRSYDHRDTRPLTRPEPIATGIRAEPMSNRSRAEPTNRPRAEPVANGPRTEAAQHPESMAQGSRTEARTEIMSTGSRAEPITQPQPEGRVQLNRSPPSYMQRRLSDPSEAYQDMRWRPPPDPELPGPNITHHDRARFQPPHANNANANVDANANVSGTSTSSGSPPHVPHSVARSYAYGGSPPHVPHSVARSYSRTFPGEEPRSETSTGEARAAVVVAPQEIVPVAQPIPERVARSDLVSGAPLASRIAPARPQSVGDRVPLLDRLTDQANPGKVPPRPISNRKPNNNPRGGTKLSLLDRLGN